MAKADYIRLFVAAYPTATVRQIATLLAARGIHCRPEYVRVCKKRPPADPKKLKNAAHCERIRWASVTPALTPAIPGADVGCSTSLQTTPAPLCVGAF